MAGVTIEWEQRPFAPGWEEEPDVIIWIDMRSFDASWRQTDQYITTGGGNGKADATKK
jgi:hypothetical protein